MSNDPLLQPYRLKHLTLRNRIMITSHEPAYPEDGMPKGRYRAYHAERAKAGVALTMTAGSAAVSLDGSIADVLASALLGLVIGMLGRLASGRPVARLFAPIATFSAALLGQGLAVMPSDASDGSPRDANSG